MKPEALHKLSDSDSSVFKDDVAFKYANDEDVIKRLCGLKYMPITRNLCLVFRYIQDSIKKISAYGRLSLPPDLSLMRHSNYSIIEIKNYQCYIYYNIKLQFLY